MEHWLIGIELQWSLDNVISLNSLGMYNVYTPTHIHVVNSILVPSYNSLLTTLYTQTQLYRCYQLSNPTYRFLYINLHSIVLIDYCTYTLHVL